MSSMALDTTSLEQHLLRAKPLAFSCNSANLLTHSYLSQRDDTEWVTFSTQPAVQWGAHKQWQTFTLLYAYSTCHSTASLKCGLACKLQNKTANGNEVEHKLVTKWRISCSRSLGATELVGAENYIFEKSLFFLKETYLSQILEKDAIFEI